MNKHKEIVYPEEEINAIFAQLALVIIIILWGSYIIFQSYVDVILLYLWKSTVFIVGISAGLVISRYVE
jgi:hypothetical protein